VLKKLFILFALAVAPPAPAQAQQTEEPYKRIVHFEFKSAEARTVFLCGSMTNWECDQLPMRRTGAGVFYINASLAPGRIEYVFVADGVPQLDEASTSEDDGKGGRRSFFLLDDDRDALPLDRIPHGRIEQAGLMSKALGEERLINVYLPPGYSEKKTYPVLFLLHGYGMDQDQWLTGGAQHYMDRYIAAKVLAPFILVMPGAPDDFYMGRSEDYIVNEVYPFIAREYSIRKGKGVAAIGGTSMGGFGALYLSYRHPELFRHALLLSPANLDRKFLDQLDSELEGGARIATALDIRVGKGDETSFPYAERLTQVLAENEVPFTYEVTRGGHDWNYWHSVMKPSLLRVQEFFESAR